MLLQNPAFVCYEWLRPFGFEWDRCVQLISSIQSQPGKQFFSATHQALVDRENIIVSPRQEVLHEVLIEEGQDKVALGAWVLVLASSPGNRISGVENLAAFDMSKIKFPLLWRKWRDGDSFVPLGMAHRKKISDFLIDLKVPLHEKAAVTVLESGGEIMWVVGRRIDDRFKVTAKTKSILEIHVLHT